MNGKRKLGTDAGSHGFTLVEMLVVISIIAILASLLTPALMKAIAAGRCLACAMNLRQRGIGFSSYINDNRGWFPTRNWQTGLREAGYEPIAIQRQIAVCPNSPLVNQTGNPTTSHYQFTGVYHPNPKLYFTDAVTYYQTSVAEVASPSLKIVLTENWRDDGVTVTVYSDALNDRYMRNTHGGKSNVLYADLRVAAFVMFGAGDFERIQSQPDEKSYRPRER